MNESFILGAVLVAGPVILVACIAIGVFGFNPDRAAAIRQAEASPAVVIEEIRHVHIRQPEKFHHDRLDRHPAYISLHVAMWGYAWCVFAGASLTSNVTALAESTRMAMATCFLVGSTLVLSGSAMGARIGQFHVLAGVKDNMTSSVLADDIRLPYVFACTGMICVTASMGIYSVTSFHDTYGSLGGWITGCCSVASALLLWTFYWRIKRYSLARELLIAEAVARIERGHAAE